MITSGSADSSQLVYARIAGVAYILVILIGVLSGALVDLQLIVPGDVASTARRITVKNVLSSERLFRFGLVAGLISQILLLLLVLTLYRLLKAVHPQRAALMVALGVTAVAIACVNLVNPLAALHLLSGADYLEVLGSKLWHAQAMVSLNSYNQGIIIAEVFWGLWLLPFGLLVVRSRFIPRILGVLLILACLGYLIDCACQFVVPEVAGIVTPLATTPAAIAELSMMTWLLIKGVRNVQPTSEDAG